MHLFSKTAKASDAIIKSKISVIINPQKPLYICGVVCFTYLHPHICLYIKQLKFCI